MADYGIYDLMEEIYQQTGGKVVVDSAFQLSNSAYLIQSSQMDPTEAFALLLNREATSIWQLSEWGMRMIQAQFPRLKDKVKYEEEGERKIIFCLMVHLYNFQTYNIGHNEILNTFMENKNMYYGFDAIAPTANEMFN